MANPFLGEIRMVGINFAPVGWNLCDGTLLTINQQTQPLYDIIGTTYGGDGKTNFALPDLRGRVPVSLGQSPGQQNYLLGQTGGFETVSLVANQIGQHNHGVQCDVNPGTFTTPGWNVWGGDPTLQPYQPGTTTTNDNFNSAAIAMSGSSQSHDNMVPFIAINYIICTSLQ